MRFLWRRCGLLSVVVPAIVGCAQPKDPVHVLDLQSIPICDEKAEYPCRTTSPMSTPKVGEFPAPPETLPAPPTPDPRPLIAQRSASSCLFRWACVSTKL